MLRPKQKLPKSSVTQIITCSISGTTNTFSICCVNNNRINHRLAPEPVGEPPTTATTPAAWLYSSSLAPSSRGSRRAGVWPRPHWTCIQSVVTEQSVTRVDTGHHQDTGSQQAVTLNKVYVVYTWTEGVLDTVWDFRVQKLCASRGGLPVLNSPDGLCVDVKQHWTWTLYGITCLLKGLRDTYVWTGVILETPESKNPYSWLK